MANKITGHIIENSLDLLPDFRKEGYGLSWLGKSQALSQALAPVNCFLADQSANPIQINNSDNYLIEGDNLNTLKLLLPELSGHIGIIYIDPPYNTGNDFGYSDNYRSGWHDSAKQARNVENTDLINSINNIESSRLHSRWLSMMLPRLLLARLLLSNDGIICLSIDDNEIDKLRLLMSEIFGEKNFLGQITVLSNPRGRQAEKHFAATHEYLLVYAKDASGVALAGTQLTKKQASQFRFMNEQGRHYRLLGLRQRGADSRQEDRPAMHYPIFVDPQTKRVSLHQDDQYCAVVLPKKSTGQPGRWMWGKERLAANLDIVEAKLIAHRQQWDIFVRDFLSDDEGQPRTRKVGTVWLEPELNYQNGKRELKSLVGEAAVGYPKPVALIKKAIKLIADRNAIVLDFFAGTGTTAQAVMEANEEDGGQRRFILAQLPEPLRNSRFETISSLCVERIRQAACKISGGNPSTVVKFRILRAIIREF